MKVFTCLLMFAVLIGAVTPSPILARCSPELVDLHDSQSMPVRLEVGEASFGTISIEWFGHSSFRLISPQGTRIITDPFGPELGLPIPQVMPHVITIGRNHPHHNSAYIAKGNPLVLHGLRGNGKDWADIQKAVRGVLVYNVPVTQRTFEARTKGSAFVFQMGGLCIAHLGDVAEALTPSQLRRLGKIHIAMIPIGGTFTVGPGGGRALIDQIRPHIAIPMHYWDNEELLQQFLQGAGQVKKWDQGSFLVNKKELPPPTQILVMGRH